MKNQSVTKPKDSVPFAKQVDHLLNGQLTMAEGMAILQYLTERKHLCTVCGYRWAVLENQYNQHCADCSKPTIVYSQRTKGSDFERILCQRFREWADSFTSVGLQDPAIQDS